MIPRPASRVLGCLFVLLLAPRAVPGTDAKVDFVRDIQPLFAKHCLSCHGPDKQKGGLRLDRKTDAFKGGDSGPALVPGKAAESLLYQLVSGADADRVMPPKGERLREKDQATLRAWIDQGAVWPGETGPAENPRAWWSLRPLTRPAVPAVPPEWAGRVRNPIDAFVLATLKTKGLSPSPEADRRTLIRRLSFDLLGLPPTPEDVRAFLADAAPDAYEQLVDRLLASPHYGERWARHWLDVVHYGDTHGYDKDKPRPNAWPYRDYVIRSLNDDKPYSRFVQEQVAGDVLFPGTADGVVALGFLAAGPWDFIGHTEVPETKTDGKIARHLDRDDIVANTMNTFVSLTVQCAQCHNHKFDPIPQDEYYRLQAVFAALDRADRPFFKDPNTARKRAELLAKSAAAKERQQTLSAQVTKAGGASLAALDERIAAAKKPKGNPPPEYGYHSQLSPKPDEVKWVQVDLGQSVAIDRVLLWPCHDTFNGIGAGFGFPVRFKIEVSSDSDFQLNVETIVDRTTADVPNPGLIPLKVEASGKNGKKGRYVRVTATRLASRKGDYHFALAELEVLDAAGRSLAAHAAVTARDSIEAPVRWRKANLVDGLAPGRRDSGDLAKLQAERTALLAKAVEPGVLKDLAAATVEVAAIDGELATVQPTGLVYAGTVHTGSGTFRGTGPAGIPRPIHLLRRGNVNTPGPEVSPGSLSVLSELQEHFALPPGHAEGARRAALAKWLTDPRNPLTWRTMVNRVWQYHFGRGLVGTPNDFGRMGQMPSHPELLDWLAADFRDNGQSLKKLHRRIVTSTTYRQSSQSQPAHAKADADNAFLWRQNRRKLDAESLRDATLAVAGKLDRTLYGPAFQDFVIEQPQHSPHYEYHLHDPADPKAYRRSVYRFLVRSKPQPFMAVLDCADPSMQVEKRNESLSPLQALALMNNGFMLTMAKNLAARTEKDQEPIPTVFRLALGRSPTTAEREALAAYAREHGLPNACRLILNLNEFAFVD